MPDQNGIMTPQEIADMGVNALLKLRAVKQQDAQMKQQAMIFDQQLKSGELAHKLKMQEFDQKEWVKRILAQGEPDPKTGAPSTPLLPGDLQRLQFLTGIGSGPTAMDQLPEPARPAAAGAQLGLLPSANTQAEVGAQTRGQDIQHQTSKNALLETYIGAGANAYELSQGDIEDPKVVAKAFANVEPTARLQAYANVLQAKAAFLHAQTTSQINRASLALETAQERNKYAPLKIFNDALGKQLAAAAQLQNAGADDVTKAANARAIASASAAVEQEMQKQGVALPPEVASAPGWFKRTLDSWFGTTKPSAAGSIDINKLNEAMQSGNLDAEIGAPQAPGAASPSSAAPPIQPNQPAATAPNSSLPLLPPRAKRGTTGKVYDTLADARSSLLDVPGKLAKGLLSATGIYRPAKQRSQPDNAVLMQHRNSLVDAIINTNRIPKDQVGNFYTSLLQLPIEEQVSLLELTLRQMGVALNTQAK
jgi:hypothetical protein